MRETPRTFLYLSEMPLTLRVVYSGALLVLGIGYLFAMIHVYISHAGRDGRAGLSSRDLVIAYSGSEQETQLEAALKGSMSGMLSLEERSVIFQWIRQGASLERFDQRISPMLQARCLACHDGSNPQIARLVTYDEVMQFASLDTGMSVATLVRASHIHLFGITFIFFVTGFIFAHAHMRRVWLKAAIAGTPFLLIAVDIGSWYLTKIAEPFSWVIMVSGVFMVLSFAAMWVTSMFQLWFYRLPREGAGVGEWRS